MKSGAAALKQCGLDNALLYLHPITDFFYVAKKRHVTTPCRRRNQKKCPASVISNFLHLLRDYSRPQYSLWLWIHHRTRDTGTSWLWAWTQSKENKICWYQLKLNSFSIHNVLSKCSQKLTDFKAVSFCSFQEWIWWIWLQLNSALYLFSQQRNSLCFSAHRWQYLF